MIAGIFFIPVRLKFVLALIPVLLLISLSSLISFQVLASGGSLPVFSHSFSFFPGIEFVVDKISGFFILTINLTMLTGILYAGIYLKAYTFSKPPLILSWHYFNLILLHLSMILVCSVRDAFPFLIAWELMTISSFILVIFESEHPKNLKTGINYLVQMHIGMFFILTAFLISAKAGGSAGFDGLLPWFQTHSGMPVFLLFFVGFGIKAGFIPFHTWLPDAHPAAPSHVSGIMSGVMIKMGIYGIVRVLLSIQTGLFEIGVFLLVISLLTGIYGVMQAIVQHDLKRLLAYHSIENIGIIGMGLGLGCIGIASHNPALAILGFGGGLLHVLNHSLFKSLLFYASGVVYQGTHTRNINQLGGLIRKMPVTAGFFLLGSLAISGLPPFNGFVSEFLIYYGMFGSLHASGFYLSILLIVSILGLTLIGGLALFCFTKAFSVTFLGEARSEHARQAIDSARSVILPYSITGVFIVLIGLVPIYFTHPLMSIIIDSFHIKAGFWQVLGADINITVVGFVAAVFILITLLLLLIRYGVQRNRVHETGPVWGCGYTAGSEKMQYTASSFSDNIAGLAGRVVNVKKDLKAIGTDEIFPEKRHFASHAVELLEIWLIDKPVRTLRKAMRGIAFLQTGQIQHYILYPFVFILIIFILSLLNLL